MTAAKGSGSSSGTKPFRSSASSANPHYLAQRERLIEGMRKAGVPEV
jgi:hypothetical protein